MINQHVSPRGAHRTRLIQSYRFFLSLLLPTNTTLRPTKPENIHSSIQVIRTPPPPHPHGPFRLLGVPSYFMLIRERLLCCVGATDYCPHMWGTSGFHSRASSLLPVPFALGSILRKRNISSHFYADDAQICVAKLIRCGLAFSP